MNLPIELISNSSPPRFRWRQTLQTPIGTRTVDHEGTLPPTVETAVEFLIALAKQQAQEIIGLQKRVETAEKRLEGALEVVASAEKRHKK